MRNLPAGEFVLVVQFRDDGNDGNGTLAVWLQGKPDDVMVVPYVPQDYNTLRIRPNYFVSDMPVQFSECTTTGKTQELAHSHFSWSMHACI